MWNDLTLKQKAEIMKMSVANGVTDINDIQQLYDRSVEHKFDTGGPYNDKFMSNYGYSWVPANRILLSDPYFKEIQEHNPNGTYAVDKNGYYIPASRLKREWEEYNSGQMNGPETAIPLNEVVHTLNDKDKQDVKVAKQLWGEARKLAYENMSNSVGDTYYNGHSYMNQLISPNEIIRRLDTINQHSTYPKLYLRTVDNDVEARHDRERFTLPDGTLRAHFDQDNFFPWNKRGNIYVDAGGKNFLSQYIAELAHNYQYTSKDINHPLLVGEHYTGLDYDDIAYSTPKYNEYRAHSVIQPTLLNYISNIDTFSGEFNPYYFNEAIQDIRNDLLDIEKKKALGGHLYKNAGPLDKAKDQPKYQYGIIEQILRENGVNFRVTSGARKPNQAGNKGNASAHTYTIFGGSPGAIDIVPGVGSDWNTLFAQMSSPKVRKALAAYGLDVLNETNPSIMASTKATGPHLHVGRGIKGQQGLGQIFGGTSYGGGRGDTYRLQYPSQRNSDYTPMYSQKAFEPIIIGGNNTSNPWLDYVRSVESIGNQGINPISNTPIRPTNTGLNSIKSTFTPTDFSSLSNSSDIVSPLEPYAAKQNIEYGLGLEGNALWNSPYLLFENS